MCYETDEQVLPVLESNMEYIKANCTIPLEYNIIQKDYITSQANDFEGTLFADRDAAKYDYIIGNPPYVKISKSDKAALSMPTVVHGSPNLYFLYAAMSLFNLNQNGEMVYIIPRSWTSGLYFQSFRKYFLAAGKLERIHIFISRNKVFGHDDVLQETMIVKLRKTLEVPEKVVITSSQSNDDFASLTRIEVPYDTVVSSGEKRFVFLPANKTEADVLKRVQKFKETLPDLGFRMKTGIVVAYRHTDYLRENPEDGTVPLFYSRHIKSGRVNHYPAEKGCGWILDGNSGLTQLNHNSVFVQRFTSKEESRRLQCGIYLSSDFPEYDRISTDNKINYIVKTDNTEMSAEEAYGIYAILESTLYDQYYRIMDDSTQVNCTEINEIPFPSICIIRRVGRLLMAAGDLSTPTCDRIIGQTVT